MFFPINAFLSQRRKPRLQSANALGEAHQNVANSIPAATETSGQLMAFSIPHVKKVLVYGLIYGLCGGLLIVVLKLVEYRFLVVEHSIEIYGGLIALVFAGLGIWLGLKITRKEQIVVVKEVSVITDRSFTLNEEKLRELSITKRELEILELIANGMSNREIAEKLFVSENTVKTHSSRLFDKLSAKRRTQAVQIGKELGLIP